MKKHKMKVNAVILAAGSGSRLGTPKAVLEIGSRPLALVQAENLRRAGISRVCIVIGCQHEMVAARLRAFGKLGNGERGLFSQSTGQDMNTPLAPLDSGEARRNSPLSKGVRGLSSQKLGQEVSPSCEPCQYLIVNKDWEHGQFSSVKAGVSAVAEGNWVLLMPVDVVGVKDSTIEAITRAASSDSSPKVDAVVPSYRGKRGHPVLLSPNLCGRIARMDARKSRLDHVLHASKTTMIEVDDEAVLSNVNTMADIQKEQTRRPKPKATEDIGQAC